MDKFLNIKNILNNFTQEDFDKNLVDLHIHTTFSDGLADYNQVIESAKNRNCKLISITDHNSCNVHNLINDEILLVGAEFDCWFKGVFIHLLAYGFDTKNKNLQRFFAKNKNETCNDILRLFANRNVKDLITAIHDAGGIAVLAHPACYWAINLDDFVQKLINIGLDGIEVYYKYSRFRRIIKFHDESEVCKIAQKYPQLIKTGGSDFHDLRY